jgi:choline dehydrogenase-like flavoprotein
LELEQVAHGGIDRVSLATLSKKRFEARARVFVLAAGGLETPRLMRASPGRHGHGLGNQNGLVGAHFCEHLHSRLGLLLCDARAVKGYENITPVQDKKPVAVRAALAFAPELRRERELLNLCLTLEPTGVRRPFSDRHAGGVDALLRQVSGARSSVVMEVFARAEQESVFESRVKLGADRDELGMPRIDLDWRPSQRTLSSLKKSVDVLASEVGRAGIGRLYSYVHSPVKLPSAWPQFTGGHHHMGTTRMHPEPAQGVVDADCRVHGIDNLFIAGSAVFPSVGYANPTLTLVALSARLARHLAERMP